MPLINICGVSIDFPFEPYACQIIYMEKVIESLKDGKNAILESPTGTGKTLCLLCAALAWQDHVKKVTTNSEDEILLHLNSNGNQYWNKLKKSQLNISKINVVPKIIYSSRTHSQLSQCINALKRTQYCDRKVGMIASREQLCINPKVMNLESNTAKIYGCKSRVKTRKCFFYNQFEKAKEILSSETKIADIEDLLTIGKKKSVCPYFLSREMFDSADITFMPYNYLLDSKIRRLYNINLKGNIVIFDEAHNIEQVCEDSASVQLTSINIASCIEELKVLGEFIYSIQSTDAIIDEADNESRSDEIPDLTQIIHLKQNLCILESEFHSIDLGNNANAGLTVEVNILFQLLNRCGFKHSNKLHFIDLLEKCSSFIGMSSEPTLTKHGIKGLEKVQEFMKTVFFDEIGEEFDSIDNLEKKLSACYRVFIQENEIATSNRNNKINWGSNKNQAVNGDKNRVLSFWCMTAGRTMKSLAGCEVRSIILTSGTLYPIETLKLDMDIKFEVELRNSHVINADQMMVSVCTKGADGEPLNSSYLTREKISYTNSLGNSILNLSKIIPRGLLVVFPSYGMMRKCIERWESCDIYNSMMQHKQLIVEPQDKTKFTLAMEQFYSKNSDPLSNKGSILLSVARGKISEGLDLSDHQGRGVIVVGLPYPSMMDPRIRLKMSFLDDRLKLFKFGIDGRCWYKQQAYRAVNQSIGRVIRHSRDFGAIYLFDERFATADSRFQLPLWLQSNIVISNHFGDAIRNTCNFFRNITIKYPPPGLGCCESISSVPIEIQNQESSTKPSRIKSRPNISAQYSSKVVSFATSLKDGSQDFAKILESYANTPPIKKPESSFTSTSLMDILKRAENHVTEIEILPVKRTFNETVCEVDDPEKNTRKVKKYKLVALKGQEKVKESNEYSFIIKRLFNEDVQGFISYKTVIEDFKKNTNVDTLFAGLYSLLCEKDQPGLVRDFYKFIQPEFQTRFAELCESVLGLDCMEGKENVEIDPVVSRSNLLDCAYCLASPALIPLGAPCKHVCCFECWKIIIEGENATRICPKCSQPIRRRNLTRLNIS
uniref:Regulator of telomere elongation helicase 1 homolog n=1 Tax=Schmidtea mediterranea TaxID=79327 RepID=H9CXU1_SCHMD|nr:RTEL1 [Schmidtea mediterranea]